MKKKTIVFFGGVASGVLTFVPLIKKLYRFVLDAVGMAGVPGDLRTWREVLPDMSDPPTLFAIAIGLRQAPTLSIDQGHSIAPAIPFPRQHTFALPVQEGDMWFRAGIFACYRANAIPGIFETLQTVAIHYRGTWSPGIDRKKVQIVRWAPSRMI